ncbi:2-dehydro-3,6-dideoxy-6-sulfogluconate aldolase [Fusarium oxysporum f. sp. albedinis]|nr:2-dehydro-3,6-dideoxy-6-sulfogluconate aldolase [Fusarium oxysporum f. sp. albedinis]
MSVQWVLKDAVFHANVYVTPRQKEFGVRIIPVPNAANLPAHHEYSQSSWMYQYSVYKLPLALRDIQRDTGTSDAIIVK